ncbi:MAG: phosphomannomutase/phosphoglucomutase [Candidatus Nanopelagicales bacterium]
MKDLSKIIKAYDVRGVYPDQLDAELAYRVGAAFTRLVGAAGGAVVVGRDMRPSGPELVTAFTKGVTEQGADVIDVGLTSTDELYFAAGWLGLPAAMFTASHNPAKYNGIKMCRAGAAPIGEETGLAEIREWVAEPIAASDLPHGTVTQRDILADYAAHLLTLVPLLGIRPLKVVVDAGNGMAGLTAPAVLADSALEVIELYYELDGTFPNHEANPIDPENLRDLQAAVREHQADIGLAFDGDADRCFLVDERGELANPSTLTALIAVNELAKHPGAAIIHNVITSAAVPEIVREHGGIPVRTRVGHSFIKAKMAETGAVFGGEHSGHFYFREFWRADSGMLAALHALAALGHSESGVTLSQILAPFSRYEQSGEINSTVSDQQKATQRVREAFAGPGISFDDLDGMTVSAQDWWFNVRPSNTEPLLRLNVEAPTVERVAELRDQVLALIRADAAEGPQ